jgi:hypothetical protein
MDMEVRDTTKPTNVHIKDVPRRNKDERRQRISI